jgi:peptide/nickel transport system substrate-binding protein
MNVRRARLAAVFLACGCAHAQQWGGELRLSLHSEPHTLHPALVDDEASETVRYLTGGVLVRVNRVTQRLEPELAVSWKLQDAGRTLVFRLREGVNFSDGSPLTAEDVVHTIAVLTDPKLHSPTGDALRTEHGPARAAARGPLEAVVTFPEPVAGAVRLFDQIAILSRKSALPERAVLGPFRVADRRPGSYLLLERNPWYWKTDGGRRLPYLDTVRLEILQNRELEALHFRQGQLHAISAVDPEIFEQLSGARDLGPSLEGEQMWFNQTANTPPYKQAWFRSRRFRNAISLAIRRPDLCRVVYHGHAAPGVGPFPPANLFWFNNSLRPRAFDPDAARRLLAEDGFHSGGQGLVDRDGHPVEFSLITNSGNRARERMAAMIQQDLAALGIRVTPAPLDFASLLERITRTFRYEACLLGLNNVDLDPNGQMNVWLSSTANHQWNPSQPAPATPWEAEMDRLMRQQAATPDDGRRKALFDRVQRIVWEEEPFLYLVNKNALVALSPRVRNAEPAVLNPRLMWNVERLWLAPRT